MSADTIGQFLYSILLLLLVVQALATAIWLGYRSRLQYAVADLSLRETEFLLAGAALICGCFFTGDNALYKGIYLLFALPGLLTLAQRLPLRLARAAFRGTCVAIVSRRRGGRRPPPRKDLAQTGHALAGGFDNRTTWLQCSLQPGMTPVPITLF
jgi:hypothetical protein